MSLLRVPVNTILTSGVVELADGTSVLLLRASARAGRFAAIEEQAALAEAYGKWLNSLTEPAAITVRSEPVDLDGARRDRARRARTAPPCAAPLRPHLRAVPPRIASREKACAAVKSCSCSAAAARANTAKADLERRASETAGLLHAAGVELRTLDGQAGHRAAARRAGTTRTARRLPTGRGDPPMLKAPRSLALRVRRAMTTAPRSVFAASAERGADRAGLSAHGERVASQSCRRPATRAR